VVSRHQLDLPAAGFCAPEWRHSMTGEYVLLVDDVRSFRDGRPAQIARTAAESIEIMRSRPHQRITQLWLDHDLAGRNATDVTAMPVVAEIVAAVERGEPYDIAAVHVHTSNPRGAVAIRSELARVGIHTVRWYDMRVFVNRRTAVELADRTGVDVD
jgi:hypothetical protein